MEALKKCPFCNREAVFDNYSSRCDGTDLFCYFVIRCSKCRATKPDSQGSIRFRLSMSGEIYIVKDERHDAIEAWNKRSDNNA